MANLNYDAQGSGSYTTLTSALAAVTALDDIIFALDTSVQTLTASTTWASSATYAPPEKPQKLICTSSFGTPAESTHAEINFSSTTSFTNIFSGNWLIDGLKLVGTGSGLHNIQLGNVTGSGTIYARNCIFGSSTTSSNATCSPVRLGPIAGATTNDTYKTILDDVELVFGHVNHSCKIGVGNHLLSGISISGAVPTNLFSSSAGSGLSNLYLSDSDLSPWAIGAILDGPSLGQNKVFLNRIKMHASTTFFSGTMAQHNEITAVNCSTGDTHIAFYYASYSGNVINDSTVYATTSPMQDGDTSISRKMTTTSMAGRGAPLQTELLLPVANDASVTPYIELLVGADGASALTDLECWIDVQAMTTDGATIGTTYTTHPGILASGTNLAAGTTAYTGDGYTTERTHKIALASSITVRQDSLIKITVNLAKPSTVVYVGAYGG